MNSKIAAVILLVALVLAGSGSTGIAHASIAPYPGAPLCPDSGENHDTNQFHTLWNDEGCHYDHEHGLNPFTPEVAAAFPDFDLYAFLGNVGVGHTNPTSPHENTVKHGGFKWDVTLSHSAGCGGSNTVAGVDKFVAQYHAFGDYRVEFESRTHSAVGMLRQCRPAAPTDYGYVLVNQHQDYGQRLTPYQGIILPYPDTPVPAYASGFSPYFTIACMGSPSFCLPSRQYVISLKNNVNSTWVSRPQAAPIGSSLFAILFRVRETYQIADWTDQSYPFTFPWLCSSDDGLTYDGSMPGCRWNNSTTRVHELHGYIPTKWDNLPGFDTNPTIGRITGQGYVSAFGGLRPTCTQPGVDCHPIKLVNAFAGPYMSLFALVAGKGSFTPENLPERDIYFCNGAVCSEGSPGAVPSGWIGQGN